MDHYNPLVRLTACLLTPLELYVLILYENGGTYSLTFTPNDRFFRNFSWLFVFTFRVFARNLLTGKLREEIFYFLYLVLMLDL